ncbi:MAG: endonuclease domain-containing protein [Burkholderiales bacterium]
MVITMPVPTKIRNLSRNLRKNPTDAEAKLWQHLRYKQLDGYKFRRQHPLGQFVVDFICLEAKLVIEVDGGQHAESIRRDERRTAFLEKRGFGVLRFWNNEVLGNIDGVLATIMRVIEKQRSSPTLTLPRKWGRED